VLVLPSATGFIQGACPYLLKHRLAISGACWSLPGAEAILLLRAAITNGDFDRRTWRYSASTPSRSSGHRRQQAIRPLRNPA
jgi:hypothetical protein